MLRTTFLAALFLLLTGHLFAASVRIQDAVKARIEKNYAVVSFADGTKSIVPLASLSADDRAWLIELSNQNPLAHGKSEVIVAKPTVPVKQTIQIGKVEGALETVQLCPPNVARDQIGATCMLYGRVNWLDIAGYYIDASTLYKLTNSANPDHPWQDRSYLVGLENLVTGFTPKPTIHNVPGEEDDSFDWARSELRRGRPILAAFPKEIWQALPPV